MKQLAILLLVITLAWVLVIGVEGDCYWAGTSPFCNAECKTGYRGCYTDAYGDGKKCLTGVKIYCCNAGEC